MPCYDVNTGHYSPQSESSAQNSGIVFCCPSNFKPGGVGGGQTWRILQWAGRYASPEAACDSLNECPTPPKDCWLGVWEGWPTCDCVKETGPLPSFDGCDNVQYMDGVFRAPRQEWCDQVFPFPTTWFGWPTCKCVPQCEQVHIDGFDVSTPDCGKGGVFNATTCQCEVSNPNVTVRNKTEDGVGFFDHEDHERCRDYAYNSVEYWGCRERLGACDCTQTIHGNSLSTCADTRNMQCDPVNTDSGWMCHCTWECWRTDDGTPESAKNRCGETGVVCERTVGIHQECLP